MFTFTFVSETRFLYVQLFLTFSFFVPCCPMNRDTRGMSAFSPGVDRQVQGWATSDSRLLFSSSFKAKFQSQPRLRAFEESVHEGHGRSAVAPEPAHQNTEEVRGGSEGGRLLPVSLWPVFEHRRFCFSVPGNSRRSAAAAGEWGGGGRGRRRAVGTDFQLH